MGDQVRKAAYQKMLEGLAGLPVPDSAKRQFEELIRRSAALDGITSIERLERVKFARHLLALKEPRATICRRLQETYGIGRSQAYQVIADAL